MSAANPTLSPTWTSASIGGGDRIEPPSRLRQVGPAKTTDELISTVADDRVERAKPRADLANHGLQRAVAGRVAIAVVDDLEVVDVDEREDEPPVRSARAVDLVRECQPTHLAPVAAGQFIEVSRLQLRLEAGPFASRVRAIQRRALAIRGGARPIGRRLCTHEIELLLQRELGSRRGLDQRSGERIAFASGLVARVCDAIPVHGRQVALRRRLGPSHPATEALHGGRLAFATGRVVGAFVGVGVVGFGRVIAICHRLVAVGGDLVQVRARVIGRRGGLIAVRCGLVGIGGRLVGIGRRLVDVDGSLRLQRRIARPEARLAGGAGSVAVVSVSIHMSMPPAGARRARLCARRRRAPSRPYTADAGAASMKTRCCVRPATW